MIAGSAGFLTFLAPWMLTGLIALPAIWWLLRLTPPRAEAVVFPPARLLVNLVVKDNTPVRTPWWIAVLRMLAAAAVVLALAGPVFRPDASGGAPAAKPLFVVVDNGWTAASRWELRRAAGERIAAAADEAGQPLYLAATAPVPDEIAPLTPVSFRQRFASLEPQAYAGDRAALAKRIGDSFTGRGSGFRVVWFSDGIESEGSAELRNALAALAGSDPIEVLADSETNGPLGLYASLKEGGAIEARIVSLPGASRKGAVAAVTDSGDKLSVLPFEIAGGGYEAALFFDLPLDLRNQVARLEISGEASAGAVFLLDSRSKRRRVGIVATDEAEDAQPLLSSAHYLDKALTPFSDAFQARAANIDRALDELIARNPSVVMLSDVGRVSGEALTKLTAFVDKGGMLVRFAGARLEGGGDRLLPAPLRKGGRALGGAMTWASPQALAPFEEDSPFVGLAVPSDVTVSRQVLADPALFPKDTAVWARLADGTPLVTAARKGSGQLVFFHVTANPDWSSLPLSGLFVDMMKRTVAAAQQQPALATQEGQAKENLASGASVSARPWRLLDGFGRLAGPGSNAQPLAQSPKLSVHPTASNPAGMYGAQEASVALNVMDDAARPMPLELPRGATRGVFSLPDSLALAPWFFLSALGLFLVDGILTASMLAFGGAALKKAGPIAAACAGVLLALGSAPSKAEPAPAGSQAEATRLALEATLDTRFAYVLTGDAEADRISQAGLLGLSKVLNARTTVEPGPPIGIDPIRDELVFFPIVYWPVLDNAASLPDAVLAKVDAYMKQGGMIIFDTKNDAAMTGVLDGTGPGKTPLAQLLGKLDLPPLQRIPDGHVLTKSFYLLQSFPGRWDNGDLWVEARAEPRLGENRAVKSDGVSSILVTSNDLAAAWALDESDRPMFAAVPGGEEQREMSYRVGVNIVMYALTGNYKADQVHVPAILERLGH